MDKLKSEQNRRKLILEQIEAIKDMRRGSVTEQYYEVRRPDGSTRRQGPYFLYSYKDKGRTVSRRLSGRTEVQRIREEIAQLRRFKELSAQLLEVSQRICDLKAHTGRVSDEELQEKKFLKRSRRRFSGRSKA
jgi:hypothetical protein